MIDSTRSSGLPQAQVSLRSSLLQAEVLASDQPLGGLYLHIPFCFHKCHYCDFYSLRDDSTQPSRHVDFAHRLIAEIDLRARHLAIEPRTIFVGGGTPTLLAPTLWREILGALRTRGILDHVQEFTLEANPETVTSELLETLRAGGVNRISIGCQSFHPHLLKTLERWHDPANVARAVALARQAGFENLNLDLIYAIPGQTLAEAAADLHEALALSPEHLSCYCLTYEPNTAMTQRLKLGQFQPAHEDLEADMFRQAQAILDAAGFEHYEISNWARRDAISRRCEHNLVYWNNENWIGCGPSAASHFAGHRWKNLPHLGQYMQPGEPPIIDYEHLDPDARRGEAMMLRLRLRDGAARTWLADLLPARDPRWAKIDELVAMGMLERTATHIRLSPEGLMLADRVVAELL